MTTKKTLVFFLALVAVFYFFLYFDVAGISAATASPSEPSGYGPSFQKPTTPQVPEEGLMGFGQLIAMIFTWSLNVLGVVVFVMIFFAGFKWFTAAGNTAQVNEARGQITNAILGAILLLSAWVILYTINPDLVGGSFSLPGLGTGSTGGGDGDGGGNYHCVETGGSTAQKYGGTLRSAMDKVISYNPDNIANALNTSENSDRFLRFVAYELRMSGFEATEKVKNGHDIPSSSHDIIGIWAKDDTTIERYDAIRDSGAGTRPISQVTTVGFTGHIPLDCTY